MTTTGDELLTGPEVAARFRVSEATVRRWAKTGQIPAYETPGGTFRYRLADVEAAMRPVARTPEQAAS